jgi:zinc transport system substrate-binding protein
MRNNILIILFLFGLISCNSGAEKSLKPIVAVSILPQKYLVESIADSLVDVVVMVPPGASPATWEATSAQMVSLSDAVIYFRIGHIGFEKAWMPKIREHNPLMPVVDLSADMSLIGMDTRHGGHSHTGIDPHIWMSPEKMESMARKVYNELKLILPEHKEFLRANYASLMTEIKNVGRLAGKNLAPYEGETFLIFHPSLGYFAKDYGLQQVSIEYEGKEPSPAHIKEVIDLANAKGIKIILVQEEFDSRNAEMIAREIGGTVVKINPLSENWATEIKSLSSKLPKALK